MKTNDSGTGRFNVSDALDVPLRGFLLRLRLLDGVVSASDLGAGSRLRLTGPDGHERIVTVRDKSLTGGRNGQARLDGTGQMDVIIGTDDAYAGGMPVGIGWKAEGPLRGEDGRVLREDVKPLPHSPGRVRDSVRGGWPFHPPGGPSRNP